jgi:hypothetical protein
MLLDLLDDRFLLDFPLEPLECALQRFAFFYNNKSHAFSPPSQWAQDL